ncbi:MAG: cell wall surface anchored protein, partial [Parcubacteria group bacterium Greene0416_79]
MSHEPFIEGKKFISASRAAEISGFVPDYIGQLCRGGKLICNRVGRSWFVSEESVLSYVAQNLNLRPEKASHLSGEQWRARKAGQVEHRAARPIEDGGETLMSLKTADAATLPATLTGLPSRLFLGKVVTLALSAAVVFGGYSFAQSEYPARLAGTARATAFDIAGSVVAGTSRLGEESTQLAEDSVLALSRVALLLTRQAAQGAEAVRDAVVQFALAFREDPQRAFRNATGTMRASLARGIHAGVAYGHLVFERAKGDAAFASLQLHSNLLGLSLSFIDAPASLRFSAVRLAQDTGAYFRALSERGEALLSHIVAGVTAVVLDFSREAAEARGAAGSFAAAASASFTESIRGALLNLALSTNRVIDGAVETIQSIPGTARAGLKKLFVLRESAPTSPLQGTEENALTVKEEILSVPSTQAVTPESVSPSAAAHTALQPPPPPSVVPSTPPVITERIIERIAPAEVISRVEVEEKLAALRTRLAQDIASVRTTTAQVQSATAANTTYINNVYNTVAGTNNLDQIGDVKLTNPSITNGTITNTNVTNINGTFSSLSGSGITLTGALTSYGASEGPYFTATSTTATSTFSGGLYVGSLGVGTTSPAEQFSVANRLFVGGAGTSTIENNLQVRGTLSIGTGTLYLTGSSLSSTDGSISLSSGSATSTFSNGFAVQTDKLIVQQTTGRVGIGTTTPSRTLSVQGSALLSGDLSAAAIIATSTLTVSGSSSFTYASTTALSSTGGAWFATSGGSVGIGTTTPWGLLSVNPNGITGPSFVVGSSTQCVTGDTRLRRRRRKPRGQTRLPAGKAGTKRGRTQKDDDEYEYDEVAITDIEAGDEVQSLDTKTGALVWSKVKQVAFMGHKPIFKLTTASGKTIRTTGNHPYLVLSKGSYKKPTPAQNGRVWEKSVSIVANARQKLKYRVGVFIDGGNLYHTAKRSEWRVDFSKLKDLFSKSADLAFIHYHVVVPRESDETYAGSLSHIRIARKTFTVKEKLMKYIWDEVEKKEIKKGDVDVDLAVDVIDSLSKIDVAVIVSGDSDYLAVKRYAEKYNKPVIFVGYQRNMAWELRLKSHIFFELIRGFIEYGVKTNSDLSAGATLTSSIIHKAIWESSNPVDKEKGPIGGHHDRLSPALPILAQVHPFVNGGVWTKTEDLKEGTMIAVKGLNNKPLYERVMNIEKLPAEDVFDIEIEGTHNFIGNDIVAHNNAFMVHNGGNVGIGTTSPSSLLSVHGNALISGTLSTAGLIATSSTITFSGLGTSLLA